MRLAAIDENLARRHVLRLSSRLAGREDSRERYLRLHTKVLCPSGREAVLPGRRSA